MKLPSIKPLAAAVLTGLVTTAAAFGAVASEAPGWRVIDVTKTVNGVETPRGKMLFTTDGERLGAAFRCDAGKLYAFVSVKPVDFSVNLEQRSGRHREKSMSYAIANGESGTEEWVSMFNGKVYKPQYISTTSAMFRAALEGADVTVARHTGANEVTIDFPQPDRDAFAEFLQGCDLSEKHRPDGVTLAGR